MLHHRGESETANIRLYAEVAVAPEPEFVSAFDHIKRQLGSRAAMGKSNQLGIRIMDLTALEAVNRVLPRQRHEIDHVVKGWNSMLNTQVPDAVLRVANPRMPLYVSEDNLYIALHSEGKEGYLASIRRIVGDCFKGRVRQSDRGCLQDPLRRLQMGKINPTIHDDLYGDLAVYRKPVLPGFPSANDYDEFIRDPSAFVGIRSNYKKEMRNSGEAEGVCIDFPEKISLAGLRIVSEVQERNEKPQLGFDPRRLQEDLLLASPRDWDNDAY